MDIPVQVRLNLCMCVRVHVYVWIHTHVEIEQPCTEFSRLFDVVALGEGNAVFQWDGHSINTHTHAQT